VDSAVEVLDLIRNGQARTRAEIARASGLGRNIVTQRIAQLLACGLLHDGGFGPSTGGRLPRQLRFNASAGRVLVAHLGATSISVALSDLSGRLIRHEEEPADVSDGPEAVLARVDELFRAILDQDSGPTRIWGVGVGVPGPVEFASGRPVSPPIMPGWDEFPVRDYFAERYTAPTWVDNDVNLMALGELRGGGAVAAQDFLYLKVGSGIGAGLVSGGRLHRGAQGCAGDIGHINVRGDSMTMCRCGMTGCLEALAGGIALARDGEAAARDDRSAHLARILARSGVVTAADVGRAAASGDNVSIELLIRSGTLVGEALASLVNFFNPSLVLIGGGVAASSDLYLATIRRTVISRSLPLATRDLQIIRSPLGNEAGLLGTAFMVIDELLTRERLPAWIADGSPHGRPELAAPVSDACASR